MLDFKNMKEKINNCDFKIVNLQVDESLISKKQLKNFLVNLDPNILDQKYLKSRNTRNAIYQINCPFYLKTLVLKRSLPNPNYKKHRLLSFYLRNIFKNYGKLGFYGAKMLIKNKIPTQTPLAYWKYQKSYFIYESCLLYEKIITPYSVRDLLKQNPKNGTADQIRKRQILLESMAKLTRDLHSKNLLHGDLICNNFLVKSPEQLDDPKRETIDLIVIDTDHMSYNIFPTKLFKRFFSLKCIRRVNPQLEGVEEYLKIYLKSFNFLGLVGQTTF